MDYVENAKNKKALHKEVLFGGLPGNRTPDTMIKSHVLYQLS
jgi:hypothetical protein